MERVLYQGARATVIEVTSSSALLEFDSSYEGHKRLRLGKGWRDLVTFLTPPRRTNGHILGRPPVLTLEEIQEVRWIYNNTTGVTTRSLASKYEVSAATIARIVRQA